MDVFVGVYLILSAFFFFWLGHTVWTLKNTVQAQASTIDAFKSLLDGMRSVLESTDETKMLARLEAHKKFVDHEMEAKMKKLEDEKQKDLAELRGASQETINKVLDRYRESNSAALKAAARRITYVPPEKRNAVIESMNFGKEKWMKELLTEVAEEAPYYTPEKILNSYLQIIASPKKD